MINSTLIKGDFEAMLKVLEKISGVDITSLSMAVGEMDAGGPNLVSYAFKLNFWQITPPDNIVPAVSNMNVVLEMVVNENLDNIEEPLDQDYAMQLYLSGMSENQCYSCSWHLDLDTEEEHRYLHPRYHLTFGGKAMKDAIKLDAAAYGQLLLLASPRIPCAPMDGILAIDFVLNHFFKKNEIGDILSDSQYRKAVRTSQERIWKPYYEAIHRFFALKEKMGVNYLPSLLF